MVVLGLTNCFLIGYETCSAEKKIHAWYCKPGEENACGWGSGGSDLKKKLLFCDRIKLLSKICFYPWINAVLDFIIEALICSV